MYKILALKKLFFWLLLAGILNSCGGFKYSDARKNPTNANERIQKNMETGKGFRVGNIGKGGSGEFMFASSNPLWRAAIDRLSFAPLSNVDYAGGIIVTDWFGDGSSNEQMKITIRFLSNEIRSDAIDVIIHKKTCNQTLTNCSVDILNNDLNSEIRLAILKKAAQIQNSDVANIKKEVGEYKMYPDAGKKKKKKKKK
jgi:hypothetical protein